MSWKDVFQTNSTHKERLFESWLLHLRSSGIIVMLVGLQSENTGITYLAERIHTLETCKKAFSHYRRCLFLASSPLEEVIIRKESGVLMYDSPNILDVAWLHWRVTSHMPLYVLSGVANTPRSTYLFSTYYQQSGSRRWMLKRASTTPWPELVACFYLPTSRFISTWMVRERSSL